MTQAVWDNRFFALAEEARTWVKGPDAGVGACIVSPDKRGFSLGFSGFPRGVEDSEPRLTSRDYKDAYLVHAELNAILNAGQSVAGWTLYTTKPPCSHCASAIIQAGIVRVVCPEIINTDNNRWFQSQRAGKHILDEAGVSVSWCEPSLPEALPAPTISKPPATLAKEGNLEFGEARNSKKPQFYRGQLVYKHGGRYGGPGVVMGETDELDEDGYRLYNVAMKVEGGYGKFVHVFPASCLKPHYPVAPDPLKSAHV